MLADEHPEIGAVSPHTLGGSPISFSVNVPDVDASVKHAIAAGGTLSRPLENKFYGHRSGEITDPFGYRWTLRRRSRSCRTTRSLRRAAEEEKKRDVAGCAGAATMAGRRPRARMSRTSSTVTPTTTQIDPFGNR